MMNTTHTQEIPYTITDSTIVVFFDGELRQIARTAKSEAILRDSIATGDVASLRLILDPAAGMKEALDGSGVQIVSGTVSYRGRRITGHLEDRIWDIVNAGLDVTPWKRFVERIYSNPSQIAVDEFALFMEHGKLPITDDGCFLAYKRVNDDYTDCHTGRFDNSVGQVLEMPRHEVDPNRHNTCSRGFHFCSQDYLRNFLSGRGRIMVVKIDPSDVVSIPSDYNNTKGRTWRYEVVGEIDTNDEADAKLWGVVNTTYTESFDFGNSWDDDEDYDDYEGDTDGSWDDDEGEEFAPEVAAQVTSTTAFVAPGPERKGIWRSVLDRFNTK